MTSPPPRLDPQAESDDLRSWLLTLTLAFGVLLALLYIADESNSLSDDTGIIELESGASITFDSVETINW